MTWAELVKCTLDKVIEQGGSTDNDVEKVIMTKIGDMARDYFDSISLARIASALYKLADIDDEITEENVWSA